MVRRGLFLGILLALALAGSASAAADRYRLAGGCYDLTRGGETLAGPLRLQASGLGRYLLYTTGGTFLSAPNFAPLEEAGPSTDWTVTGRRGDFQLTPQSGDAAPGTFSFSPATGCADFPEADTDVDGRVSRGTAPWAETRGLIDSHFHWMAADMFGGDAHCGRAWSPYGIARAMVDCPDHAPGGVGLQFENLLSGNSPTAVHDTVGWPTFKDWPNPRSLTHENAYYRWVQRAYQGGLRMSVVLFFDNAQLCGIWPEREHDCDEMASIRREIGLLKNMRDYIDAQAGGPGRGFMKIVRSPFAARRAINHGKLAVVMGIETSRLFDCRVLDGVPQCDQATIDRELAEMRKLGIRSLEITGKFDNALAGVAGDPGTNGIITNTGNRLETGRFLAMGSCEGLPSGAVDKEQLAFGPLGGPVASLLGNPGASPVYPPPPHCNALGLSDLGGYLMNQIVDHHMIMDPDHMSANARIAALDIMQKRGYSGLISSHSWSTPVDEPRIINLGGVVYPKATAIGQASTTDWFTSEYERLKKLRNPKYLWGFGYGSDMNGIAKQATARPDSHVTYPFTSYDGKQTVRQLTTGQRTWDFGKDGVANYGMYLDWLEELRQRLGAGFVADMERGPEAYLQMWERAYGVPATPHLKRLRVGMSAGQVLRRVGQPRVRGARVWRYRGARVRLSRAGRVTAIR